MPLEFRIERSTACQANGPVYAIPHVLKGWQSVGRLPKSYLGNALPDLGEPEAVIANVRERLDYRKTPQSLQKGLMAVEIAKLCMINHDNVHKPGRPILERGAAFVLAVAESKPFGIRALAKSGILEATLDPPVDGAGAISPIIAMDATSQEAVASRLTRAIRSAPLAGNNSFAYVALRDFETIVYINK